MRTWNQSQLPPTRALVLLSRVFVTDVRVLNDPLRELALDKLFSASARQRLKDFQYATTRLNGMIRVVIGTANAKQSFAQL